MPTLSCQLAYYPSNVTEEAWGTEVYSLAITSSLACQLAESEVISPTSRVTRVCSDLPLNACDAFLTMSTARGTCLMHTT